ncbi:hypothetical protein FK531_02145 [Rhodococcus spelaei]|uniref:Uncharacterized protein n=1 Tax=Rhodococcus spelaei TaxID=2546320 RepID=A0A541BRD2_9NOCA|nr:hypothetical protein [Rhodococcus spelaei]TQF74890.1 hypothetical protein FK531_02145 [Rhodococcus spelaei]
MSISSSVAAAADPVQSSNRRPAWAAAGVVAGLAGIVGIQASTRVTAVYDESTAGDPVAIVNRLTEQRMLILVEHMGFAVAALALLVFAAGLARLSSCWPARPGWADRANRPRDAGRGDRNGHTGRSVRS